MILEAMILVHSQVRDFDRQEPTWQKEYRSVFGPSAIRGNSPMSVAGSTDRTTIFVYLECACGDVQCIWGFMISDSWVAEEGLLMKETRCSRAERTSMFAVFTTVMTDLGHPNG